MPELPRAHLGFPRFSAKEKDPGSAFGPEAVPLATGLVPVVYWVPGPFPGPTPPSSEPGAGLISNLPLIPAMSIENLPPALPKDYV